MADDQIQDSGLEPQSDYKPPSLDSLINDDNPTGDPAKVADTAAEPEKTADEGADKGEKAEPAKDAPPASSDGKESDKSADKADAKDADDKGKGPDQVPASVLAAIRKDKDSQLAERDAQIASLRADVEKLKERPRPDEIDDPEGAAAWDAERAQADEDARWADRVEMSKEIMRELHDDYDEAEAAFRAEAATNPSLRVQLRQSPLPAKFAYSEGKRILQVKEMGDNPAEYIEKVKQEAAEAARAAVLDELKKQGVSAEIASATKAGSLAEAASAKTAGSGYEGPKPIEDLLGDKR